MSSNDELGKMFVGGLSWETSQEALCRYFSRFGEVVDCVVMKNSETGRSRGFGFVTFKDSACVPIVVSSAPHNLDGRTIDPKSCNPRSQQRPPRRERDNNAVSQPRRGDNPKIFLGGLPPTVNESELSSHFSKYGKVSEVVIMYDQEKKRSRGFGFVSFETDDSVDRVCAERYIIINGKQVEAKRAEPREGRSMGGGGGGRGRPNDNWNGNGMGPGGMSHHGGPPMGHMDNGGPPPSGYPAGGWGPPSPQGFPTQGAYGAPTGGGGYPGWGVPPNPYGPYAAPQYVPPPSYATGYGYGYGWPTPTGVPVQMGIPPAAAAPPANGSAIVANGEQYGSPPVPDYGAVATATPATAAAPAGQQKSPKQDYSAYASTYSAGGYTSGSGDGTQAASGASYASSAPAGGRTGGAHAQSAGYHPYRRQ